MTKHNLKEINLVYSFHTCFAKCLTDMKPHKIALYDSEEIKNTLSVFLTGLNSVDENNGVALD